MLNRANAKLASQTIAFIINILEVTGGIELKKFGF